MISDKVDAANARIEFENGAVANITASRIGTEKIRKTRFYQTNAYVVLDYATKFASLTSLNPNAAHPLAGISINRLEINDVEPLRAEITAFLDAIENDNAGARKRRRRPPGSRLGGWRTSKGSTSISKA